MKHQLIRKTAREFAESEIKPHVSDLDPRIATPAPRPQVATVRPGTFQELPHNYQARGEIVTLPLPADLPARKIRCVTFEQRPSRKKKIEDADIVIAGGRGMGSKGKFKKLFELAELMQGEVGATRSVVYADF